MDILALMSRALSDEGSGVAAGTGVDAGTGVKATAGAAAPLTAFSSVCRVFFPARPSGVRFDTAGRR